MKYMISVLHKIDNLVKICYNIFTNHKLERVKDEYFHRCKPYTFAYGLDGILAVLYQNVWYSSHGMHSSCGCNSNGWICYLPQGVSSWNENLDKNSNRSRSWNPDSYVSTGRLLDGIVFIRHHLVKRRGGKLPLRFLELLW